MYFANEDDKFISSALATVSLCDECLIFLDFTEPDSEPWRVKFEPSCWRIGDKFGELGFLSFLLADPDLYLKKNYKTVSYKIKRFIYTRLMSQDYYYYYYYY